MAIDHLSMELMIQECRESLEAAGLDPEAVYTGVHTGTVSSWRHGVQLLPYLPDGWIAPMLADPYMNLLPWARTVKKGMLTCFMKKHIDECELGPCKLFPEQPDTPPQKAKHVD